MSDAFHPDLKRFARVLPRGVGRPWLVRLVRLVRPPAAKQPPHIEVSERVVDGGPVKVRIYRPRGDAVRPAVLWIHGGGYVMGTAQQDDGVCGRLADRLNAVVVSVDYRLAPDHPFPTPLEDCFAAYEWLLREASSLGVDVARIAIAGQSAGGGLTAALALLLHDRRRPPPVLQVLIYPMLDDRTVLRDLDGRHHRLWDAASNRFGWTSYLGRDPGDEGVVDHAAPARRVDVSGLPPAWVGVGTCDLFHDEDLVWAKRLKVAGVATDVEVVDGAFHGFDAVAANTGVARKFFESFAAAMERAFAR